MKIKDFALQEGVTPQAVYKLLKTHSEALEGHVLKGKKSTDLDEFAIAFLQEKMVGNNVIVADRKIQEELDQVKKELKTAQDELIIKNQMLIAAQNNVLKLQAESDEAVKSAEDKLKLNLEQQHRELVNALKEQHEKEIEQLTTQLQNEKSKSWVDKLFRR